MAFTSYHQTTLVNAPFKNLEWIASTHFIGNNLKDVLPRAYMAIDSTPCQALLPPRPPSIPDFAPLRCWCVSFCPTWPDGTLRTNLFTHAQQFEDLPRNVRDAVLPQVFDSHVPVRNHQRRRTSVRALRSPWDLCAGYPQSPDARKHTKCMDSDYAL